MEYANETTIKNHDLLRRPCPAGHRLCRGLSLGEAAAGLARGETPGTRTQNNFRSPGGALSAIQGFVQPSQGWDLFGNLPRVALAKARFTRGYSRSIPLGLQEMNVQHRTEEFSRPK